MAQAQSDSLIGSVLSGRYELVARINRGGTAVVYRAIDRRLGRTVAVKVIHSDLSGDPDYVKRFDREARAAAILSHPNIVAVFDQGLAGERPYIVMEYIRGQSLRAIISASAPLPPAMALAYADEVAKAVSAAHNAGIIHRDIKPENVLITNDGKVKVTDFGLAKNITAHTSTASQGVLMGTMSYIAPEIPSSGSAFKASDVYSTGIVLFEMLTGKKPHTGEDFSQVIMKHVNVDVPPPSRVLTGPARARIPDYVDALVAACTTRNSEDRIPDGRVLQEMISKARRSLEAGKRSDPDLVKTFSTPVKSMEATPTAPIPLPQVVPPPTTVTEDTPVHDGPPPAKKLAQAPSKPPPRTPMSQARKQIPRMVIILILVAALVLSGIVWWIGWGSWARVPNLTGMNEQDARTRAAEFSFTVEILPEYSETIAEGLVIRTDPPEGSRAHRDSTITVVLSRGPERYDMPTVVGLTREQAAEAIENAHLKVGETTEAWDEQAPVGQVIGASEEPGAKLKANTPINVTVSKGREPLPIVDYTGKGKDEAVQGIEASGFVAQVNETSSCKQAKGVVDGQSPWEGTAYRGDTITITVSTGPQEKGLPDVYMLSKEDATRDLNGQGFRVSTEVITANPIPGRQPTRVIGVSVDKATILGANTVVSVCNVYLHMI
ncbi:MAG: Stk1 family PASTA domain-containing Ser/Thr kinase [Propionibacteriaceae bacterium]|jgi:serine/threonine-protein kinase|nr:Stk1 family PASTA domain-containing Ser/Thr kinase [Propionibacteriaceae bacterium]